MARKTNKQNNINKSKMNPGFQIYTWKTIVFLKLFGEHVEKRLSYELPWSEIEKQEKQSSQG